MQPPGYLPNPSLLNLLHWKVDSLLLVPPGKWKPFGLADVTHKVEKQQIQLYNTGNYIQYPVVNHNEKEYLKSLYVYN